MDYVASLVKGEMEIDLAGSGAYRLGRDFTPPGLDESYNISNGTAGNALGGSRRAGRKIAARAFTVPVHIAGDSSAEIERAVDELNAFLGEAGDEDEPVYFKFRPKNIFSGSQLLGVSNTARQVKLLGGRAEKGQAYWMGSVREHAIPDCQMYLTGEGSVESASEQWLGLAKGGVIEDYAGMANGTSRGVIVAEATTNKMVNPIFGHSTWSTSWTTGADLQSAVNTDKRYVLFGKNSVRLIKKTTGSAFSFYASVDVGNTNTHCLALVVRKNDGSAISSSDIRPLYGATSYTTATYLHIGNGWYKIWVTFAGVASAQNVGCTLVSGGVTFYLAGMQLEEKAYPTAQCWGDLHGHAWSGTVHNSSSSRTAGALKYDAAKCLRPTEFTWWVAFRALTDFSTHASSVYLLEEATTTANVRIGQTGQVVFTDGTNSAVGTATAITAGTILIIHATMSSAGLKLYRNGVADGAGNATFAPLNAPTYLFVGSYSNSSAQVNAALLGYGTYDRAMSATEVANDYANLTQRASGGDGSGRRVDWAGYFWTKDGDNILDQVDDSTHANWGVVAGIPGTLPARTMWHLSASAATSKAFWLMQHLDRLNDFRKPADRWWLEASGTVDANASGGEYHSITAPVSAPRWALYDYILNDEYIQGDFHFFLRAKRSAAASIDVGFYLESGNLPIYDEDKTISLGTAYQWNYIGKLSYEKVRTLIKETTSTFMIAAMNFQDDNASGSTHVDCGLVVNGKIAMISATAVDVPGGDGSSISDDSEVYVIGHQGTFHDGTYAVHVNGSEIDLEPERLNTIFTSLANDGGAHVLSDTITVSGIRITPRWAML